MKKGDIVLSTAELPIVRRGLRAILGAHTSACRCAGCQAGKPLLTRIEDKLTTPVPRGAVDQGEARR